MAIQLSVAVRNARLNAIETTIGTAAVLKIYDLTAGAPADCAASITGTILATMTLPTDWMNAAGSGQMTYIATWSDASADASGTADFFRIFASDGTTCGMQGTVGQGTGDLSLVNTVIVATQGPITISAFTLTDGNA